MKQDQKVAKGQKLRSPVDALPAELVFFGRVTNMLRGLCSTLDVKYPYLQTMSLAAQNILKDAVLSKEEQHSNPHIHISAHDINTPLQQRLIDAIHTFQHTEDMVGMQISVFHKGIEIANIAGGVLGKANPHPVTPSSVFCIFSVSKAVLTLGMLRLKQDYDFDWDDPVCKFWPAFAAHNKQDITIRHVLSHQAGLANVMPNNASIDTLLDWDHMKKTVEDATPTHEAGKHTQYHYLSFAWLCGGIIEAITGAPYEEYLNEKIVQPLHLEKELFMGGLCDDVQCMTQVAALTVFKSTQKQPPQQQQQTNSNNRHVLAKYQGRQQLMNNSVFNMKKVQQAKLPSANGHASAHALARVFDAVLHTDTVLSSDILEQARIPQYAQEQHSLTIGDERTTSTTSSVLQDSSAPFGLGLQMHRMTVIKSGEQVNSIGHAGFGGSIVLAIPELNVSLAFVTNMLSAEPKVRNVLLKIVLDEFGIQAPPSLQLK